MDTLDRIYKTLEFCEQENEHKNKTALDILLKVVESTASITDDAKRIEAFLLHRHECGFCALTNKFEISYEWSKMENTLHDESFWKFINPNPNEQRYAEHRMNFIIEMLLRCEKDGSGNFVDVSTLLHQNSHYLFQRCLPIMLDMETDKVPFLQCDIHLDELIDEVLLMPNNLHEISPGMFALWIALRMTFERLWSWYTFLEPDPTEERIAADINGVRDLLSKFITVRKEDLIMSGRTYGEYLEEEECEGGESTIKQVVPSNNNCTRHVSGIMNMNDYYFYVAPDEEDLGWEFTISDLIESEFEANPDNFPDKSAKIEFLKGLIADIEECIEKVENEKEIVV